MDPSNRTESHLIKAQQLFSAIDPGMRPSVQLTQAQDAAEHAFRAILFGMSVSRIGHHELHLIAKDHQAELSDVWSRLSPLLDDYEWLWEWRNKARYQHVDTAKVSDPPIDGAMVARAVKTAGALIAIAETLI